MTACCGKMEICFCFSVAEKVIGEHEEAVQSV